MKRRSGDEVGGLAAPGGVRWYRAYRAFGRAPQVIEEVARFVQRQRLTDTVVSLRVERQASREFYLFLTLETEHWGLMPEDLEGTLDGCRALSQPFGEALTLDDIQGMASGDLQVRALGQCLTYRALVREAYEDPFEVEARVLVRDAEIPGGAAERLLWFLSATGSGSWATLRAAGAALGVTDAGLVGRLARHLRLLGHLEVFPGGRWTVAAPGVVEGASSGQRFLVGARDARSGEGVQREAQAGGPDRLLLGPGATSGAQAELGNASERLTRALPHVHAFRVGMERLGSVDGSRMVAGRHEGGRVVPGPFEGAPGLYQLRQEDRTRHALFRAGQWWTGEFFTLRFLALQADGLLGAWRYDRQEQEVAIRHEERLPELYERALVLCSGRLPENRGGWLVYRQVPAETVSALAERLAVAVEQRQGEAT